MPHYYLEKPKLGYIECDQCSEKKDHLLRPDGKHDDSLIEISVSQYPKDELYYHNLAKEEAENAAIDKEGWKRTVRKGKDFWFCPACWEDESKKLDT